MQGVDLDRVYERFKNELELQKMAQIENVTMRFNERELKEIIYLLGNLKAMLEREEKRNEHNNRNHNLCIWFFHWISLSSIDGYFKGG